MGSTSSAPARCPAADERYILVNAAEQRLHMFEGGKEVEFDAGGGRQAQISDADDGRA